MITESSACSRVPLCVKACESVSVSVYLHHPHVEAGLRRQLLPHVSRGLRGVVVGVLQRLQLLRGDGGAGSLRCRVRLCPGDTTREGVKEEYTSYSTIIAFYDGINIEAYLRCNTLYKV